MLKPIFWIGTLYVVVSFARPQDDRIRNKSPKVEKKSIHINPSEIDNEVRVDLTKNITTKATSTIAPIKIAIQPQCTR